MEFDRNKKIIIAGPCSAESEDQIMQTALGLKATGLVSLFRAGIWKQRTRANNFEGVGSKGLLWLRRVKKEIGLPTGAEITLPSHVEECLKNEIDVLWIGARTTVNPILVQELCNALRGVNIPVMIKNPINPSIDLWVGAVERFELVGIKQLFAIHRGFSIYDSTPYRNDPGWKLMQEFRTIYPNIPMICDPSHIAGKVNLIPTIAKEAISLGVDGLMIESHVNPPKALSDAQQQLTPIQLQDLVLELTRFASK